MRPQTGQGLDLLLGARFPRVLENCPSVGLLLSYMDFCSPYSEFEYQKPLRSGRIESSGFLVCTGI
jgi:hypothetical protein